jgi:hypothetical protein
MTGAAQSRLQKSGGDVNAALAMLKQEYDTGAKGWSPAQIKDYEASGPNGAWAQAKIRHQTKGKFSGPLGAIGKAVSTIAPYALPLIPGLGPVAAGLLSAGVGKLSGKSWGASALQGAGSAAGSELLGGQGYKGIGQAASKLGDIGQNTLGTIGKTLKSTFMTPGGGLNLGNVAAVGSGIAQLKGQSQQRKSFQARAGAEDELRNMLIQRLMQKPNYNFTPSPTPAYNPMGGV